MPLTTPNRLYPYPIPLDPTDIPGDMQRLAEAIDDDVCALQAALTGRPVARFRGTGSYASPSPTHPVNSPPTPYTDRVPFDTEDFNTANVTMLSADVGQRLIWPQEPGFYFALATVAVPPLTVAGSVAVYLGLQIRLADGTNPTSLLPAPRLAGISNPAPVGGDDRNMRLMALGCGSFMNGTTDAWSVEFRADTTPDVAEYVISERTITVMRMTQS